jgi:hypothetical protein
MKKLFYLSFLSLFLFACSEESINNENTKDVDRSMAFRVASDCAVEYDLLAGQHILAGKIIVDADADNIYVTYETSGDWTLTEVHLHVGQTFPTNNGGNPRIGNFQYKMTFNPGVTSYTFTVPQSAAGLVNGCTKIAAHAVVRRPMNDGFQTETGWGGNIPFGGNSWARYFNYCIEICEPESCDTAFMVGNNTFQSLNIGQRWGWAQYIDGGDGVYVYPFHAGAGQNNLSNGYQAGTVTVTVSGSNVNVAINLFPGVSLDEQHVYVNDNVPTTTAPGQYKNFTTGTFPNFSYSGDGNFWIIVHGVTCTGDTE